MTPLRSTALLCTSVMMGSLISTQAWAAIALDRTRVIFDGDQKSMSLNVSNYNKQLPYLAQAWIEDPRGNKTQLPLTALPPIQRIEPGGESQVKLQSLPGVNQLQQDRESLFYFNLREIPPRSSKPNTLQLALQTRIKLFYRPRALKAVSGAAPWQEKLRLTRSGNAYQVNNPTPYYITLVTAQESVNGPAEAMFKPVMIPPKGNMTLKGVSGSTPVLTYINDYGGQLQLAFHCAGMTCTASPVKTHGSVS